MSSSATQTMPVKDWVERALSSAKTAPRETIQIVEQIVPQIKNAHLLDQCGGAAFLAGDFVRAAQIYKKAILIDKTSARSWSNLGVTLRTLNAPPGEVVQAFQEAMYHEPDISKHRVNYASAVRDFSFHKFNAFAKQAVTKCLTDKNVSGYVLSRSWHSLLWLDPDLKPFTDLQTCESYDAFVQKFDIEVLSPCLHDPFIIAGLTYCRVGALRLEVLFLYIRRWCLENYQDCDVLAEFIYALAIQMYGMEYISETSDEEIVALKKLKSIASKPHELALVACYENIEHNADISEKVLDVTDVDSATWDFFVEYCIAMARRQVKIKDDIPAIGSIKQAVSRAVQAQYEEHPFPRWLGINHRSLKEHEYEATRGYKVLIAGCGTGQEAALVSNSMPYAEIDAIDLSLSSLAYAKDMCAQKNYQNINFHHGDLLEVGALGKKYDIIFASGVLHHMEDPVAGLNALKGVLADGGVMRIALYSELGRKSVKVSREWIAEQGLKADMDGVRAYRRHIATLDREKDEMAKVLQWRSFFSFSEIRDLVFHVQEHRYSLEQLDTIFKDNDLDFLLVRSRDQRMDALYDAMWPNDTNRRNLQHWHKIEEECPDLFSSMYFLWLCHAGKEDDVIYKDYVSYT